MNELQEGLKYNEMKGELQALRKKLEDLENKQSALGIGAHPAAHRRFSRRLITASITVAALLVAAGGLLWGQGEIKALFIDDKGNVGIGTTSPKAALDVNGTVRVGGAIEAGGSELVFTNTQKKYSAADNMPGFAAIYNDALHNTLFISGRSTPTGRVASVYDKLGIGKVPQVPLDVGGDARIQGTLTYGGLYQRDDDAVKTYEIPTRYHLSLTAGKYGGRTKTIPQDTLVALCGGPDGCEVRLGMTRWENDAQTETASRSALFYYSASDGHWRAIFHDSMFRNEWGANVYTDTAGVDGNGKTEHVLDLWHTCYFTDGTYNNYTDLGDKEKGMQLLVWGRGGTGVHFQGFVGQTRTCELTLIK